MFKINPCNRCNHIGVHVAVHPNGDRTPWVCPKVSGDRVEAARALIVVVDEADLEAARRDPLVRATLERARKLERELIEVVPADAYRGAVSRVEQLEQAIRDHLAAEHGTVEADVAYLARTLRAGGQ